MIILNIACAICLIPTVFLNIYAICLGRLFFGFFAGIYQLAVPRMIEETVPVYLLGIFGTATNIANNAGKMVTLVLGAAIPDVNIDKKAAAETNLWRMIFGIPWIIEVFCLAMYFVFIR